MKSLMKTLIIFMLIGLCTVSYGIESSSVSLEDQLQKTVVLPIDYHDKVFIKGGYAFITGDYQVELQNNRTYLPIRLMTTVLSNGAEMWEAHWEASQPNEVILYRYYGNQIGSGWSYSGDTRAIFKLQVGSKTMLYNGEEVELSDVPQKVDGRIVLPIRAIGEALKKQIVYTKGLVFISNEAIRIEGSETEGIIKELFGEFNNCRMYF